MFDYLGTFTEMQLRERNAWLDTQIHALSASLEHLLAEADRLVRVTSTDVGADDRTYTTTHEQDGRAYVLTTTTIPKVVPSGQSMVAQINIHAERSRYLQRVDPVSGDITISDSGWNPSGKLPRVGSNTIDDVSGDDAVAAVRMQHLLKPFRGMMKRQEYLEEKAKKAKYRYLILVDEIEEKTTMLETFSDEVVAIDALLSNSTTITNTAGATEVVSEYPTVGAGADGKLDIADPSDPYNIDELADILLPGALDTEPESDQGDATAVRDGPSISSAERDRAAVEAAARAAGGNASVADLVAAFPSCNPKNGTGSSLRSDGKDRSISTQDMQWLANIFAYGFTSLRVVSGGDGLPIFFANSGVNRYLALNAADGIEKWASLLATVYPHLRIRVTEMWPPSQNHHSVGHFTGHSADVTFAVDTTKLAMGTDFGGSTLTIEIIEAMCTYGVENGCFSSYINEYKKATDYSTGSHVHLDWKGTDRLYLNSGSLKNVTPETLDPAFGSAPLP